MAECHVSVLGHCVLDLISRIIVSVAYLIYYLGGGESQIFMDASLDADMPMPRTILGHCDLDLRPSF